LSLNNEQLKKLNEHAIEAAVQAASIISKAQGKIVEINIKEGGENLASQVVTEIDLQAEQIILEKLKPSRDEFQLGILTEESPDDHSRFELDYFWCVDPLDGTLAFSQNEEGYSVSIALVSKTGESVIGVVANPRTGDIYTAIKGKGAYKNEKKFEVSPFKDDLTLFYDLSYLKHPKYEEHIDIIKETIDGELILSPLGGAVMNGISTIECSPALYYKIPKKEKGGGCIWDFAASSIIQSEAGGLNSDFFSEPLLLNKKGSPYMNEKGVIFSSHQENLKLIETFSAYF